MKKLPIAAAALLFGTSAYAMIPSTEPSGAWVDKDPYTVQPTAAFAPVDATPAVQPASADWWQTGEPVAYEADKASFDTFATADEDVQADALADETKKADEDLAMVDQDVDAAGEDDMEPTPSETTALDEEPVPVENGVGGPYEAVDTAAADVTPRPAAQNYPACRPGRGDDNCIQLYEPGVQEQLASWTQPTGGFAGDAGTQVAMGGPYEPADSATATERLNQQALADSARAVQVAQAAAVTTDEQTLATAQADEDGTRVAMGGPYEPVAEDAAMNGDGTVETALGETAEDEIEV